MKIKKTTKRKICLILVTVLLMAVIAPVCMATGVSNTGVEQVDQPINSFFNILFALIRVIGLGVLLWGIVQFAQSFIQHDPSQRITSMYWIIAGMIVTFAKEILKFIGITL